MSWSFPPARLTAVALVFAAGCAGDGSVSKNPQSHPADTAADASATAFRAIGTEPFWALEIGPAGLRFTTPEDTVGIRIPPITPTTIGDTLWWTGETERAAIDARIWRERAMPTASWRPR